MTSTCKDLANDDEPLLTASVPQRSLATIKMTCR